MNKTDEIILDTKTFRTEESGQLTLFYDDSEEPPEPDNYESLGLFLIAWENWECSYPHLIHHGFTLEDKNNGFV